MENELPEDQSLVEDSNSLVSLVRLSDTAVFISAQVHPPYFAGRCSICVIPPNMSILEYRDISHMKSDSHMFVLSTEPFQWDKRLLRYLD